MLILIDEISLQIKCEGRAVPEFTLCCEAAAEDLCDLVTDAQTESVSRHVQ